MSDQEDIAPHVNLNKIQPGVPVKSSYYIAELQEKTAKNGNTYCDIILQDKTGRMSCKFWDQAHEVQAKQFVFIEGRGDSYNGNKQVIAEEIYVLTEDQVDMLDFYASLENDEIKLLWSALKETIDRVSNTTGKLFINALLDKKHRALFKTAIAGIGELQSRKGMLLKETVAQLKSFYTMAESFELMPYEIDCGVAGLLTASLTKCLVYSTDGFTVELSRETMLFGFANLVILVILTLPNTKLFFIHTTSTISPTLYLQGLSIMYVSTSPSISTSCP